VKHSKEDTVVIRWSVCRIRLVSAPRLGVEAEVYCLSDTPQIRMTEVKVLRAKLKVIGVDDIAYEDYALKCSELGSAGGIQRLFVLIGFVVEKLLTNRNQHAPWRRGTRRT
jgi:hypothetical protein